MKGSFPYDEMSPRDHKMIRAAYWAMIDLIDVQVGRMLDYLEQSGQLHDTLILFTSDHGENLGDHGMYLKGPSLRAKRPCSADCGLAREDSRRAG